jgi:hypothetical protein
MPGKMARSDPAVTTRRDMLGCQRLEGMGCRTSEVLARRRIVLTPRANYIQPDA